MPKQVYETGTLNGVRYKLRYCKLSEMGATDGADPWRWFLWSRNEGDWELHGDFRLKREAMDSLNERARLPRPVTIEGAKAYIRDLHARDLLYHFDDDAEDCLRNADISKPQVRAIQDNVDAIYEANLPNIAWGAEDECPIGYALKVLNGLIDRKADEPEDRTYRIRYLIDDYYTCPESDVTGVKSLEDAIQIWISARDQHNWGSRACCGADILDAKGGKVAFISYNGRAWINGAGTGERVDVERFDQYAKISHRFIVRDLSGRGSQCEHGMYEVHHFFGHFPLDDDETVADRIQNMLINDEIEIGTTITITRIA